MKKPIIQSLWIGGNLSRMEIYSIKSFLNTGHEFHLYTYDKITNIPKGVIVKDGNEILSRNYIFKLKESFASFADIFRYKMLYEKGNYWGDLDMIAIKKFDFKDPYVFSSERTIQKGAYKLKQKSVATNSILKAPKHSEFYKELYELCIEHQKKKKKNQEFTQYMRIMRDLLKKYKYEKYVKPPHFFCNLDWWYAKDAFFDVDFRNKYGVKAQKKIDLFKNTYSVHFWRHLVKNKYKLSLDEEYDKNSLWEQMIYYVDTGKIPKIINKKKITKKKQRQKKQSKRLKIFT